MEFRDHDRGEMKDYHDRYVLDGLYCPNHELRDGFAKRLVEGRGYSCLICGACRYLNIENPCTENLARFADDLRGKRKLCSGFV